MALETQHDHRLEEGLLTVATDEKKSFRNFDTKSTLATKSTTVPSERMPPARHLVFTLLVCCLVSIGLASVIVPRVQPCLEEHRRPIQQTQLSEASPDGSALAHLLNSASPDIVHRLLHAYFPERYQHGVYPSDEEAVAALQQAEDTSPASSPAQLAKRQDNSTTSEARPPPASTVSTSEAPPPPETTSVNPPPRETTSIPATTPPATTNGPPPATSQSQPPNPPQQTTTTTPATQAPPPNTGTSAQQPSSLSSRTTFTSILPPTTRTSESSIPVTFPSESVSPATSSMFAPSSSLHVTTSTISTFIFASTFSTLAMPGNTRSTGTTTQQPVTTSFSEVRATVTSTMENGDVTIVTRTSYVGYVPTPQQSSTTTEPAGLQNAGVRLAGKSALSLAFGAVVGALMLV